jgi:SecD/SecF fusion protein
MIGIAASMFTALFVTRLVFDLYTDRIDVKSLSIGRGIKALIDPALRIIPQTRLFIIISSVVIIGSLGVTLSRGGFNWGIDFTGGNVYQVQFKSAPDVMQLRKDVEANGIPNPKIRSIGTAQDNQVLISIEKAEDDSIARVAIKQSIGQGIITGEESVGPRIGEELKWDAIWASLLALVLIVIYIWVRFGRNGLGFGLGAVVALFHDILVTLGIFGMLGLIGFELSLTFVAAILTIVGYSLNDTIVVFDRVRENIEITGREGFAGKVNKAINQSLSRTLITSLTTFFVILILAILGGEGIKAFAVAMIIGVLVGTYSSMAVASPFVVWWAQRTLVGLPTKKKKKK